MLGVYDRTVILTYISMLSAGTGIIMTLSGLGHPYIGSFFLLFCGLCDAFDGKVARMKKNRSELEKNFGIQIDSLSDLVAFGVLPGCIGISMMRTSPLIHTLLSKHCRGWFSVTVAFFLGAILILYMLAALIRLAYFNVTEEQRQKEEGGVRRYYTGLPVTSAALIFPFIVLLQYCTSFDITPLYMFMALLVSFAFLSKIRVCKPGFRGILFLIFLGMVEFVLILLSHICKFKL